MHAKNLVGLFLLLQTNFSGSYPLGTIFFSSQDVFRTFSQNEVLIIVFGFLELSFRCFTVVYLAKTPSLFSSASICNLHWCYTFCTGVTSELHFSQPIRIE